MFPHTFVLVAVTTFTHHNLLALLTGRCYGAEICTLLLLLRCSFRWYSFLAKSNFGQKPWTIVHGLISASPKKVVRKVYHPIGNEKRNLMALISVA